MKKKPCVFFLSLFFITLQWFAQTPPPPNPPSLTRRGGGVFCLSEESQRVCNNEPSIIPCNRGTREGSGEVFYGSTHSRTLYIVSLLIIVWWPTVVLKDVSLSIKKYKIFFIPDICGLLCFTCCWCWFTHHSDDSYCLYQSWPTHCPMPVGYISTSPRLLLIYHYKLPDLGAHLQPQGTCLAQIW